MRDRPHVPLKMEIQIGPAVYQRTDKHDEEEKDSLWTGDFPSETVVNPSRDDWLRVP